ncbi:MAG: Uncharacterized protein FD123_502 [Bacteroidetes bacterium]|nr:MAG: Uncharacterized protein FD123_502 [Bacteroidota bacterium]
MPALFLYSVLPLFAGGMLYVLYRPLTLRFFACIQNTAAENFLLDLRETAGGISFPGWIIYNLPCGLWLFAFVNALFLFRASRSVIMLAVAFPLLSELAQATGWLSGTFDILDLLAYSAGAGCGLFLFRRKQFNLQPA